MFCYEYSADFIASFSLVICGHKETKMITTLRSTALQVICTISNYKTYFIAHFFLTGFEKADYILDNGHRIFLFKLYYNVKESLWKVLKISDDSKILN